MNKENIGEWLDQFYDGETRYIEVRDSLHSEIINNLILSKKFRASKTKSWRFITENYIAFRIDCATEQVMLLSVTALGKPKTGFTL